MRRIARHSKTLKDYLFGPRSYPKIADIVFLTHGNRIQQLNNKRYQYMAGPLCDLLKRSGRSVDVWQIGHAGLPMVPESMCFGLEWDNLISRERKHFCFDDTSKWFDEHCSWALRKKLDWSADDVRSVLSRNLTTVEVWKEYLKRSRCRLLIVDVWYGSISALIAAAELGIITVDYQHGLQGDGHFAYDGWDHIPSDGFAAMPDYYWVWGDRDANALLRNNSGIRADQVIIGGNPWLNMWRDEEQQSMQSQIETVRVLTSKYSKVVLVTLQKVLGWRETLESMIREAPADWLWLIRKHRLMPEIPTEMEESFHVAGMRNVLVEKATSLALYALMQVCDWHLTWFSTCALEALAFGKPTMLLHTSGVYAYQEFIDLAVMFSADGVAHAIHTMQTVKPSPDACVAAGHSVFAASDVTEKAVKRISLL
ncbi:MAG: hypothetical protein HQ568_05120 [Calditrichaeota bacterium]|nr:hypothetical protein [Calditrichota bacterium]